MSHFEAIFYCRPLFGSLHNTRHTFKRETGGPLVKFDQASNPYWQVGIVRLEILL